MSPVKRSADYPAQDDPTSLAALAARMPRVGFQASASIAVYHQELVGKVIDVTYEEGRSKRTFTAKVTKWDPSTGFHHINSKGLSMWKGQSFTDVIDVNIMNLKGLIRIHTDRIEADAGRMEPPPVPKVPKGKEKQAPVKEKAAPMRRRYGQELVGELLEVTYPEGTFRVKVVKYLSHEQWHLVDSEGLSTHDGESFTDEIIIDEMEDEGNIVFLGRADTAGGAGAGRGPKAKGPGGRRPKPKAPVPAPAAQEVVEILHWDFTDDILNQVVDIYYDDPPGVYRMRVTEFDEKNKWHRVVSYGKYGTWDGCTFSDLVDLSKMHSRGKAIFVKGLDLAKPPIGFDSLGSGGGSGSHSQLLEPHELEGLGDGEATPAGGRPRSAGGRFAPAGGKPRARPTAKKRGRPPKVRAPEPVEVQEEQEEQEEEEEEVHAPPPAAKRKAGRPPKARAPEPMAVAMEEQEDDDEEDAQPPAKKKGPGQTSSDKRDDRRGPKAKTGSSNKRKLEPQFGEEICGQVLDLTYIGRNPGKHKETFRVAVLKYDAKQGLHLVSSRGHSLWNGLVYKEEVNINKMYAAGEVTFVEGEDIVPGVVDQEPPPPIGVSTRRKQTRTGAPPAAATSGAASVTAGTDGASTPAAWLAQGGGAITPSMAGISGEATPQVHTAKKRRLFGPEMVGRVLDVSHTEEEDKYFRVHVAEYDLRSRKHRVESYSMGDYDNEEIREWLDLNGLNDLRRLRIVDGQDILRKSGHALVGEEVHFMADADKEEVEALADRKEQWTRARIVGWWPQEMLPPVAVEGHSSHTARQAIFVAEETGRGDRWQLTLDDAMLAAVGAVQREEEKAGQRQALFEVFAGSCELSLAFRRAGAAARCYDVAIDSTQDFATDDGFVGTLEETEKPWDIVHFAPPETDDPRIVVRLAAAVRSIHAMNRGFAVECSVESKLWAAEDMQELERLEGVEGVTLDLESFGAPKPMPVQLLTNRAEWLGQLSRSKRHQRSARTTRGAAARAAAAAEDPAAADLSEEGLRRYPRAFCEAFAELVLRGAAASEGGGGLRGRHKEEDEEEDDEAGEAAPTSGAMDSKPQHEQPPARTVSAASEAEGNAAEDEGKQQEEAVNEDAEADGKATEEKPSEGKRAPHSGKEASGKARKEDVEEESAKPDDK